MRSMIHLPTIDGFKESLKKGLTKAVSPWILQPERVMIDGLEYVNLGEYDKALEKFDRVIYITLPSWRQLRFDAFFNKGVTLAFLEENRKAIESFMKAIKIYKKKSK